MIKFRLIQSATLVLVSALLPNLASAHWSLDNDGSTLSFVTVKADHVAEAHTFDMLSGTIDDDGSVAVTVELASVNTLIPIRNERMQAMLFETNLFPQATISADVDLDTITAMAPGSIETQQLNFSLSMRDVTRSYTAEVLVTRVGDGVIATTLKPVIVTAESYGLVSGVEALREIAGLPSISQAVPVSFTIKFEQGH